jgi:secreted PhoX family phosphatase
MITKYSPTGAKTRGTVNNCANGYTPWGTYLTCEENWAGYFPAHRRRRRREAHGEGARHHSPATRHRHGTRALGDGAPDTTDESYGRWSAAKLGAPTDGSDDYRNAPNTFGWVVEIDPFTPSSTPKKRTALGRLAHEGCWPAAATRASHSSSTWGATVGTSTSTSSCRGEVERRDASGGMAAGDKYLDDGKLYVAKFGADGTGQWIELAYGAATSHRPTPPTRSPIRPTCSSTRVRRGRRRRDEDGSTRSGARSTEERRGLLLADEHERDLASARQARRRQLRASTTIRKGQRRTAQKGNPNGHVIRIAETGADHSATTFTWDIYLLALVRAADRDERERVRASPQRTTSRAPTVALQQRFARPCSGCRPTTARIPT